MLISGKQYRIFQAPGIGSAENIQLPRASVSLQFRGNPEVALFVLIVNVKIRAIDRKRIATAVRIISEISSTVCGVGYTQIGQRVALNICLIQKRIEIMTVTCIKPPSHPHRIAFLIGILFCCPVQADYIKIAVQLH